VKELKSSLLALAFTLVASASPAAADTLTTTFAGGNEQNGNIFDVTTGANSITLTSLGLNIFDSAGSLANLEFYYRLGTSVGVQNDPAGWTLFSTNNGVTAAGENTASLVDITDLTLAANTRYGLYFTRTDGGLLHYTNGTAVGNVAASNSNLTVYQGYGEQYPFAFDFSPRTVNATFNYDVNGAVPEPASWAMMILGMGAVGGALRRRSKVSTTVKFA
jgi:hypothetical protein